jgi:flagellar hook-associated protein 3 FlgL
MSERTTLTSISNTVLADNQRTIARMATYQEQLASGKRINRVSDDPVAARQALRYRAESLQTDKWLDNVGKGSTFVDASDTAFGQMSEVLDQAKQLAVQGANGTQDAASRRALAQSADSLLTRLVDLGNTMHDGRYLFSGTATLDQPFARSADGSRVTYQGNLDTFAVQVGPGTAVTINRDGHTLFQGDTDVFAALGELRDALLADDPARVSAAIGTVDAAHGHVNELHGALGGVEQRLDLTRNQLEQAGTNLGELLSQAEDVDFADVLSQLQLAQVALQAGLESGAKVIKPTLLDYL